jgi:mannosyltransferase OCH1-like enzyme
MLATRISRPLIKFVANFSKVCCYGFHALFPSKRFSLPAKSQPILNWSRHSPSYVIPRVIWQTNYTARVTLPVYLNYLFNRLMSPSFAYRFMVTEDRESFIRTHFPPQTFRAYQSLQIGAAQADFWRLLVLEKHGGVYMDIDAHLIWPLSDILRSNVSEVLIRSKTGELSNYFIASKPGNPLLKAVAAQVQANIESNSSENVYNLTGPGVFNFVLKNFTFNSGSYLDLCNQGNFTNEYFQYLDKPQGKWTREQSKVSVIRKR